MARENGHSLRLGKLKDVRKRCITDAVVWNHHHPREMVQFLPSGLFKSKPCQSCSGGFLFFTLSWKSVFSCVVLPLKICSLPLSSHSQPCCISNSVQKVLLKHRCNMVVHCYCSFIMVNFQIALYITVSLPVWHSPVTPGFKFLPC